MMKKSKRGSSKIYWPRVRKPLSVTIGYGKLAYNCTAALDRILCRRVNASTQQHWRALEHKLLKYKLNIIYFHIAPKSSKSYLNISLLLFIRATGAHPPPPTPHSHQPVWVPRQRWRRAESASSPTPSRRRRGPAPRSWRCSTGGGGVWGLEVIIWRWLQQVSRSNS